MSRLSAAQAETITHVVRLVEAFRAFDSDNDDSITEDELGGIMSSLGYGPTVSEVKAMMLKGDTNKDGLLSIDEFLEMNTNGLELGSNGMAASLKDSFGALQALNGEEFVTVEELFEVMGTSNRFSLDMCNEIISSMDGDGDGAISFEDFKIIINSLL